MTKAPSAVNVGGRSATSETAAKMPENCQETAGDCQESAAELSGSVRQERRRAAFIRERLSPRARDLFHGLIRRIGRGRVDILVESHALRVAELIANAETLRAALSAEEHPTPSLINSVTRLESTAARAERALFRVVPPRSEAAWSPNDLPKVKDDETAEGEGQDA